MDPGSRLPVPISGCPHATRVLAVILAARNAALPGAMTRGFAQPFDKCHRQLLRVLHDGVTAASENDRQIATALPIDREAVRGDMLEACFHQGLARILDAVAAGITIAIVGSSVGQQQEQGMVDRPPIPSPLPAGGARGRRCAACRVARPHRAKAAARGTPRRGSARLREATACRPPDRRARGCSVRAGGGGAALRRSRGSTPGWLPGSTETPGNPGCARRGCRRSPTGTPPPRR